MVHKTVGCLSAGTLKLCVLLYSSALSCCGCVQGLWPNYIKVVPSIAIAFVTYEQVCAVQP